MATTTLYRPVGPDELKLIHDSEWQKFPPRLPEQPIFYPVMNLEYAVQITQQWNVPDHDVGYVTEFDVDTDYMSRFETHQVGGSEHEELWVPSEKLDDFNAHIVGSIRVVGKYTACSDELDIAAFVDGYAGDDEALICFAWNGNHADRFADANLKFRRKVCDYFTEHRANTRLGLIAALFLAETRHAREAWCVHPVVSALAEELLERGGTEHMGIYMDAMGCGMDGAMASRQVSLSPERLTELIDYCRNELEATSDIARGRQFEFMVELFQGLQQDS